jgi:hypothetical protein
MHEKVRQALVEGECRAAAIKMTIKKKKIRRRKDGRKKVELIQLTAQNDSRTSPDYI